MGREMTNRELADFKAKLGEWERKVHSYFLSQNIRQTAHSIVECCVDMETIIVPTTIVYAYLPDHMANHTGSKSIGQMVERGLLYVAEKNFKCRIIRLRMPLDPLWFNSFVIDDEK